MDCNKYAKYAKINKVELYKWSSSEFPEESALIYTSDDCRTSTLQLSVSRDKVLCKLADSMCNYHPLRLDIKVSAERDSNGDCKFGKVVVAANGTTASQSVQQNYNQFITFSHSCCQREGYFIVKSTDRSWEFSHNYDTRDGSELRCYVCIQCKEVSGLCVGYSGPFVNDRCGLGRLLAKREVLGKPPKALIAHVESEFEEGKIYTLFQRGKGYENCGIPASVPATPHISPQGFELIDAMYGKRKSLPSGRYNHFQVQRGKKEETRISAEEAMSRFGGITIFERGRKVIGKQNGSTLTSVKDRRGGAQATVFKHTVEHTQVVKDNKTGGHTQGGGQTMVIKNTNEEDTVIKINNTGGEAKELNNNLGGTLKGLVNNSIGHTHGHFNGCVFNDCQFYTSITITGTIVETNDC